MDLLTQLEKTISTLESSGQLSVKWDTTLLLRQKLVMMESLFYPTPSREPPAGLCAHPEIGAPGYVLRHLSESQFRFYLKSIVWRLVVAYVDDASRSDATVRVMYAAGHSETFAHPK